MLPIKVSTYSDALTDKLIEELDLDKVNHPEYILSITSKVNFECGMEEFKDVLTNAINYGGFDVLYLDDFLGNARLYRIVKKGLGTNIIRPVVCKRDKSEALNRKIVKHNDNNFGSNAVIGAAVVFGLFTFVGVVLIASRNGKGTGQSKEE